MVKFIILILTMSEVKLLVYVEIMNEDVCRLHLTLCIVFFLSSYWFLIQVLNIEGFQFEQSVNFTSTKKSWTYIPKWDIQNKKWGE